MERTRHDLRCRCSMRVKLAEFGRDIDGRTYLHIRAHKGARVITNSVHKGGEHELMCNHCRRVTRIYLTPRGSRILPPSTEVPELMGAGESTTLPCTADDK